jgi:hypothetical protein
MDGGLVALALLDDAVEAVVGDVGPAADEPSGVGDIPLEDAVPLLEPVQLLSDAGPELLGVIDRLLMQPAVLVHRLDVGLLRELRQRIEEAVFLKRGLDC